MSKKIVIVGGGLSSKHAAEALMKKSKDVEVTIIQANKFVEWPLAMTVCLVNPDLHKQAIAPNCEEFEVKGVSYKYAVAESVDTSSNRVKLAKPSESAADEMVPYDALIVATGFGVPLVYPRVGSSLEERIAEVRKVGDAIKSASSIVIAGGGPIGLELAGDIRGAYPQKKVTIVCKKGILTQWPEAHRAKVQKQLVNMNIELVCGDSTAPTEYCLEPGKLTFGEKEVAYDVFLPAFSQGPNTTFLEGVGILDSKGRVEVNEYLQSKACNNIFAVGVSNVDEPFIGMPKLEAQWNSVANNANALLSAKALTAHKEGGTFAKLPPLVLIGHGATGYGFLDFNNVPAPIKCCCCGGLAGWPCCPPCWPCCACGGCGCCPCGYCCGPPEGKGPSILMGKMAFKSAGFHFKGVGKAPTQQTMTAWSQNPS